MSASTRVLGGLFLLLAATAAVPAAASTAVFVELSHPEPTVVARWHAESQGAAFDDELHRAAVRLAQDEFLGRLAQAGVAYTLTETGLVTAAGEVQVADRYTDLVNAMRLEVDSSDVALIRGMPQVRHVSGDHPMELHLNKSVSYIRANGPASARSLGIRGAGQVNPDGSSSGQVIAVLDTGQDHTTPMYDLTTPDGLRTSTSSDTRPVRLQGSPYLEGTNHPKVGYRFLFAQAPIAGDDTGHGTNSGTTAAGLLATADEVLNNGEVVEGVAPGAVVMDYKTCPSLTCVNAQALLALEDCIQPTDLNGFPKPVCTAVNMSFGSTAGDPNTAHGIAAGNLQFAGTLSVASAGNSGPQENIVGSPSSSRRVVSVAATTDPGSVWSADVLSPSEVDRGSTGAVVPASTLAQQPGERDDIVLFPMAGTPSPPAGAMAQYYVFVEDGRTPAQWPASAEGRIGVVRTVSPAAFAQVLNSGAAAGAVAVILLSNTQNPTAGAGTIPGANVSLADGDYLLDLLSSTDDDSGDPEHGALSEFPIRINPSGKFFVPDTADFSSRGPNNDFLVVKPDITAPGVSVLMGASKIGALGSPTGFIAASGTSFSGPHVAGSVALMRDASAFARSDFSPSMVRAALMNSSTRLRLADGSEIAPDDDNNFIHETGAGLVHVVNALMVQALMGTNELNGTGGPDDEAHPDFLPSHSFGQLPLIGNGLAADDECQQRTITVTMADVGGGAATYDLSIVDSGALRGDITRPLTETGFSVALGAASVGVPAGGSGTFDVTISADGTPAGLQIAGADVNGDLATEFLWHVIAVRRDASEETLRMPFFARFNTGSERVCPEDPPVNNPPVAVDDSDTTFESTAVAIDVLANDSDPDGDPLEVGLGTDTTSAQGGTVTNRGADVVYTPPAGFTGIDTFTYEACDPKGACATATVTVEVRACDGDDDDFDSDGKRDDQDSDDDGDGDSDNSDSDDDNDGDSDNSDSDDDNDCIDDDFDSESARDEQSKSSGEAPAGGSVETPIEVAGGTLLVIAAAEGDGAEALRVEILDPYGALLASSVSAPGQALATAVPSVAGQYTVRVTNPSASPVAYQLTTVTRSAW